jgi:hypothetical protein
LWLADLRRTLAIWRASPALPLVGLVVAVFVFAPNLTLPRPAGCGTGTHPACTSGSASTFALMSLLSLPFSAFGVGLLGAERWWYAKAASGDRPHAGQLWRVSWSYFWRFLRLGLLVGVLSLPVTLPILFAGRHSTGARSIALAAFVFILDIALTFVTPAMALSTDSAWQALKTGIVALDRLWPRDAPYAVVPPMALTIVTRVTPNVFGSRLVTALAGVAAQLLTMFFAGAVTLLYLRDVDPEAVTRLSASSPGE